MPPPSNVPVELPLKVEFSTNNMPPLFKIPPPLEVLTFPEMRQSATVSVPLFEIPAPPFAAQLEIVRPERVTEPATPILKPW